MRHKRSILEAALMGLAVRFQEIEARISAIQEQLGRKHAAGSKMAGATGIASATRKRRPLSPAAKKRIAAAQRERWAKFHAEQAKPKLTRRRMSPARRAALVANLAKARAARAAKRAAA